MSHHQLGYACKECKFRVQGGLCSLKEGQCIHHSLGEAQGLPRIERVHPYQSLADVFSEALHQAADGGPLYQAVKKIYESQGLEGEKGVHELLGAINYIAAAIIVRREVGGS